MNTPSISLGLGYGYLRQLGHLRVGRPAGNRHPTHGYTYTFNYDHLVGVLAPHGDDYYLSGQSANETDGVTIAVIHHYFDDKVVDDKSDAATTDNEIHSRVAFRNHLNTTTSSVPCHLTLSQLSGRVDGQLNGCGSRGFEPVTTVVSHETDELFVGVGRRASCLHIATAPKC